eukprot:SAG11_NODE_4500_length_1874_cov_1.433239_1_plen_319_part_00
MDPTTSWNGRWNLRRRKLGFTLFTLLVCLLSAREIGSNVHASLLFSSNVFVYFCFDVLDNEDGSYGTGVPSTHAALSILPTLGLEIPEDSDSQNGAAPGPHIAPTISGVQEIQVRESGGGEEDAGHRRSLLVVADHRSLQMDLGGLNNGHMACDMSSIQTRANTIDARCCPVASLCANGVPRTCELGCAMYFVPFYEDCGLLLSALGTDLSSFHQVCSTIESTLVNTVLHTAVCTPILSCHNAVGPLYCVDATQGGGATAEQLEVCTDWQAQGGHWMPSTNPCRDAVNLITNGGFETDPIAAGTCECVATGLLFAGTT